MQKVIDYLIVSMFIVFSILTVAFIGYAGYAMMYQDFITTIASIIIGLVCFWLSVLIAKVFQT